LPKSFLSVKVSAPNNYRAAFVGRFNLITTSLRLLRLLRAAHSSVERFEILVFKFLDIATAFSHEKTKKKEKTVTRKAVKI